MALHVPPTTHLGGLNPVFNPSDCSFISAFSEIIDSKYLIKANGGNVTVSTTFSKTLTLPSINTRTVLQIGYYHSFSVTLRTVTNSTSSLSSAGVCNKNSLVGGDYLVKTIAAISGSASIDLTFLQFRLLSSSSSFKVGQSISSMFSAEKYQHLNILPQ